MIFDGTLYDAGKMLELIKIKLAHNEALRKLVYYSGKNIDDVADIEPSLLYENHISTVPYIKADDSNEIKTYIIITPDLMTAIPSQNSIPYRIKIDILCHVDAWTTDYQCTRPMLIAEEIYREVHKQRFNQFGLGYFEALNYISSLEYSGLSMLFTFNE